MRLKIENLKKYKQKLDIGFKDFVKYLETMPNKLALEVITNGFLEDPVYMTWVLKNLEGLESLFKLDKEDVLKIYKVFPNSTQIFLRALKNQKDEMDFVQNKLPSFISKQYLVDLENEKVTQAQQEDSRIKIIQVLYQYREERIIPPREFFIPPLAVLDGSSQVLNSIGQLRQFYENGAVAILGEFSRKKKNGEWVSYYENGKIYSEGHYVDGLKEGVWCFYFSNGKIKTTGEYKEDLKIGEWKTFDESGKFAK